MSSKNLNKSWSYKQIVIAVDETLPSKKAFEQALAIAKAFQATLNLIHILSPLPEEVPNMSSLTMSGSTYPPTIDESLLESWQLLEQQGLELLQSLTEIATDNGVSVKSTQLIGQPEQKICEFALDINADLIVVGSHGRTGLSELFLGSVSNYVAHHVPCAVLLVHQSEQET